MLSCQSHLDEWTTGLRTHLPTLSKPQATGLALWSLGRVLARSCALRAVSVWLAALYQRKGNPVRQQWREWCDAAPAKRGARRPALAVDDSVKPLLGGVLRDWQGTQVALALDATTLSTRFTVLAIRVVSRGCAMPVAWTILPAHVPHAWRRHWLRLRRHLRPAVSREWTVRVWADRGLYAPWLFRRIVRRGGHPVLRINHGGTFRPDPQATDRPLTSFVPQPGTRWHGTGTAFKRRQRRLRCTLWACGEEGYSDPGLIVTDLPPTASEASWYGLRAWIEPGFTMTTRAGWPWQRTRMTQPDRAARVWLAVAVATRWLLSVGGMAEATSPAGTRRDVTDALASQRRQRRATRLRLVSILRRGWITILVALLTQTSRPRGAFRPEPWPRVPTRAASHSIPDPEVRYHVAA